MHARLRPYATAGVALVGASVIAVAPSVAPLPPDIAVSATPIASEQVHLSALEGLFDLGAIPDPFTQWIQLFGGSFANLTTIGEQIVANGAPALRQLLANQFGYASSLGEALQGAGESVVALVTSFPEMLTSTFELLAAGEIDAAVETFNTALLGGVLGIAIPFLLSGALVIPVEIAQNATNVIEALIGSTFGLALSALGPIFGTASAFGGSAQSVYDAFQAGETADALSGIINMPPTLLNAFLNGYDFNPGLLTPVVGIGANQNGLIATLAVYIPQMIAAALGANIVPGPPIGGMGQGIFSRMAAFLGLKPAGDEVAETSSAIEESATEQVATKADITASDAANATVAFSENVSVQVSTGDGTESLPRWAGITKNFEVTESHPLRSEESGLNLKDVDTEGSYSEKGLEQTVDEKDTGSPNDSLDTSLELVDSDDADAGRSNPGVGKISAGSGPHSSSAGSDSLSVNDGSGSGLSKAVSNSDSSSASGDDSGSDRGGDA